MLCEKCHQKEAVVKFTQIVGDQKKALNLCRVCMENQGLSSPLADLSKIFGKLIIGILSEHLASKAETAIPLGKDVASCPQCGTTWMDFEKSGHLGCPGCYVSFIEPLKVLLRRLHGSNRHIGSPRTDEKTKPDETVEVLEKELARAVAREDYETAATLRDRIREKKLKQETSSSCPTL